MPISLRRAKQLARNLDSRSRVTQNMAISEIQKALAGEECERADYELQRLKNLSVAADIAEQQLFNTAKKILDRHLQRTGHKTNTPLPEKDPNAA